MTIIALIGLGEVGRVLAEDLPAAGGIAVTCWDTAFDNPASPASRNASELSLRPSTSATDAVLGANLVISAVTAANDKVAAEAVARGIEPDAWFLDLNSASPTQKQSSAEVIERAGGRYVEAAVMSPIDPHRLAAPILLGGRHAQTFADIAEPLGFTGLEVYSDTVGPAAATELCRSIVIKGVEALLTESMLTARAWGVEDHVLASLSNLLPADDWEKLAGYMITRALEHGARRSEEMLEAAATVADAGLSPIMASATAQRQAWSAGHRDLAQAGSLAEVLDAIWSRLPEGTSP